MSTLPKKFLLSIILVAGIHAAGCGSDNFTVPMDTTVDWDFTAEDGDAAIEPGLDGDCPEGMTNCGGVCVDPASDPANCGECGNVCTATGVHTVAICQDGECSTACEPGWSDLDGEPGCESPCTASGPEVCNGVDDDCNGRVDDTFPCRMGMPVVCTTTCDSVGTGICTLDCQIPPPGSCTPPSESCNGRDDDCDGYVDEDWPPGTCSECTPNCEDRECGPDPVCSQSCGECDEPDVCNEDTGQCFCTPDCGDRECGPDPVCGQPCGECGEGVVCDEDGTCSCIPECGDMECGLDPVCSSSCGECDEPDTCDETFHCVCIKNCTDRECGPDPVCDESCGECDEPFTCDENGHCVCEPECGDRECGPDPVCEISCGECDEPMECNEAGECSSCRAVFEYNFNTGPEGWTAGGYRSDWQQGAATSGPMADHDGGGSLWGTNLSGNAQNCQDSWIESPAMDLSGYSGSPIKLVFWTWYRMRPCDFLGIHDNYSGGVIEVYNGATWNYVVPEGGYDACATDCVIDCSDGSEDQCDGYDCAVRGMTGFNAYNDNSTWRGMEVNLSSYAVDGVKVRFHYGSHDGYGCAPRQAGWYVDEVSITVDCD